MTSIRKPTAMLLSSNICRQCARTLSRPPLLQQAGRVHFSQRTRSFKHPYQLDHGEIKTDYKIPPLETKDYEYHHVKGFSESPSPERMIIDVREPSEVKEGFIPGAINIPIKSNPDALFLPEEEFEDRFGFVKPPQNIEVIFYCRSGVRANSAAQFALQQGYQNVASYTGSWLDWQKQGGAASKP